MDAKLCELCKMNGKEVAATQKSVPENLDICDECAKHFGEQPPPAKRAQTINQFVASVRRCGGCPADMEYQINAWPYPQAEQSHIAFWRGSWDRKTGQIPDRAFGVRIANSDCEGVLMTIRAGGLTPREVVAKLNSLNSED